MISVVIPCYEQFGHGARHMNKLLHSIAQQIGAHYEVIVSDNSEDDAIRKVCMQYVMRMKLHYHRNDYSFGVSNNTNAAISHAEYDKIKIMYSDDYLFDPHALELFDKALNTKEWAVSNSYAINGDGTPIKHFKAHWDDRIIQGRNTIGMPSVIAVHRNELVFDPSLTTLLDCEYYYKLYKEYGEPAWIATPLVAVRYWDGSMTRRHPNRKVEDYAYIKLKHGL